MSAVSYENRLFLCKPDKLAGMLMELSDGNDLHVSNVTHRGSMTTIGRWRFCQAEKLDIGYSKAGRVVDFSLLKAWLKALLIALAHRMEE
jgi:hypothetical protein